LKKSGHKPDIASFSPSTAVAVIVANMIGTGVFTSLGFQLLEIQSGFALLMLWVVGGVTALCGALTYAELGSALPRSGGEYNFLKHCYHPVAGFIGGWVSSTIGFSAPVALAAMTFGAYLSAVFPQASDTALAAGLIVALTLVHASSRRNSAGLQWLFTGIKLLLIVGFCVAAIVLVDEPQTISFSPGSDDLRTVMSGTFAISLIYVSYAYMGWNAATYLSSELANPRKTLPGILVSGSIIVMLAYVALNFVFLYATPIAEMQGKVEVGYIAAGSIFGESGAYLTGVIMSLLLISTVSAMTLAGPRVLQVIGEDYSVFRFLAPTNSFGVPRRAIYFQSGLALIFVFSSTFESVLVFSGFSLALNNFFTVLGVFVLRIRQPELRRPYRIWLFPLPPIIFLLLSGWTLTYILAFRTQEAVLSLMVVLTGGLVYWLSVKFGTEQ
jgi:APA family basic amino acid/polyamine antiporter